MRRPTSGNNILLSPLELRTEEAAGQVERISTIRPEISSLFPGSVFYGTCFYFDTCWYR